MFLSKRESPGAIITTLQEWSCHSRSPMCCLGSCSGIYCLCITWLHYACARWWHGAGRALFPHYLIFDPGQLPPVSVAIKGDLLLSTHKTFKSSMLSCLRLQLSTSVQSFCARGCADSVSDLLA